MNKASGMTYAPKGESAQVVAPGQFAFAAVSLEHGHIFGMCNGLIEAGAELKWVYDLDPAKVQAFLGRFPGTQVAESEAEILEDSGIQLVAGAAIPSERGDQKCLHRGMQCRDHGRWLYVHNVAYLCRETHPACATSSRGSVPVTVAAPR